MRTLFVRALNSDDKAALLRATARGVEKMGSASRDIFEVDVASFGSIPRTPFAYWVGSRISQLFETCQPFEIESRSARQGLSTADDFRFVRVFWELDAVSERGDWFPFAKGGVFSPFYADAHLALRWGAAGNELKAWASSRYNNSHWSRILKNTDFFFRPGFTWPRRTQGGLSFRAMPQGCIFADKGPAAFVAHDDHESLLSLLAVVNSAPFRALVDLQMAFGSYEVGVVQRTPVPAMTDTDRVDLARLARRMWSLRRLLDTRTEASHAFALPALLQTAEGESIADRADAWAASVRAVKAESDKVQAEIDNRCFELYRIGQADRGAIGHGLAGDAEGLDGEEPRDEVDEADDEPGVEAAAGSTELAAELVSWAVGVAFGRFDVRLATDAREPLAEPDPFDPLPVCSPGMLVSEDRLPVSAPPPGYPVDFRRDGILVDDPGDARDLKAAVRAVFDVVFGANADMWWDDAAALLDPRGHDLRAWLRSGFFERHLKLYSKSRRKAPILWQLGTPSGRYSIWLYAPRLTNDSLFQLQNDVLAPKLDYEERQLTNLVQASGVSPSARDRREIEAQERFVEELRGLLEEVKIAAPLCMPTFDDGIVLVISPLWRLVSHTSWHSELKKKWSELAAGRYDWAHLAMHLWPERVVPKCSDDRSLAIAHGLEDCFWVEDEDGKWHPRQEPTTSIDDLIRDRTSAPIKDALGALG